MSEKIVERINEYLDAGKIFTAFTITESLRKDGLKVFHREVKKLLGEFDLSVYCYSKTQALSDVFNPKPFIYYPDDLEETNEVTKFEKNLVASITDSEELVDTIVDSESEDESEEDIIEYNVSDEAILENWKLNLDSRGKVSIPNSVIKRLFVPGDKVCVWNDDQGDIVIVGSDLDVEIPEGARVYTVDKSSNIRISWDLFGNNDLDGDYYSFYSVMLDNDEEIGFIVSLD